MKKGEQKFDKETAARRLETTLRVALTTPPKPRTKIKPSKPGRNKKRGAKREAT